MQLITTLAIISIAIGGMAGDLITKIQMKQLGVEPGYAAKALNTMATGDLSVLIIPQEGDSSSPLYHLKTMGDRLNHALPDVVKTADQVQEINTASAEEFYGQAEQLQNIVDFSNWQTVSNAVMLIV